MEKQPEIERIHDRFKKHDANYIHFSIKSHEYDFLYVLYDDHTKYSLFFGEKFRILIPDYKINPKIECLECELGMHILGGISIDTGDFVDFNLSIVQANQILKSLELILNTTGLKLVYFGT